MYVEHMVKMVPCLVTEKCHQSVCEIGRVEGKLNGNHLGLIPGFCLEDRIN